MINNLYIKATPTTAAVTWGSITGTLSSQTDLQSALNAKQDALTLTTTGTSGAATFVGSTLNIPQYGGGGGLQGINNIFPAQSGQTITNRFFGTSTNFVPYTNNVIRLHPFLPNSTFTTSAILLQVLTGQPSSSGRILIYSNLSTKPNSKLYESATIDFSTAGNKSITTSFTFTAGTVYWIGFQNLGTATIASLTNSNLIPFLGTSAGNAAYTGYQTTSYTFGSAPATMGVMTAVDSNFPLLLITVA